MDFIGTIFKCFSSPYPNNIKNFTFFLFSVIINRIFSIHIINKGGDKLDVKIGTVKWFNHKKGFGVISPDKEGEEVIVYFSSICNADYLLVGQKVSYIERQSSSGVQAEYVVIL